MPRRRYLDKAAPADATYNSIRPVYGNIQVKKKDTPQRRENEAAKARAREAQYRRERQGSIGPYREKTAIDKAGGRLYAAAEQRAKDAQDREAAGVVLNALFKPIMPSTYVDMYDAYKRGEVNGVSDALAAPYLTGSWSQRNPGKALATDILAPTAIGKAGIVGRNIANRNLFTYAYLEPWSYLDPVKRGGKVLKHILIDNKLPNLTRPAVSDVRFRYMNNITGDFRDEAFRKYLGLPERTPLYVRQADGTYGYNMKWLADRQPNIVLPVPHDLGNGVSVDLFTGNGGNIGIKENPLNKTVSIEDAWDINPFSRIPTPDVWEPVRTAANKLYQTLYSKLYNSQTSFGRFGYNHLGGKQLNRLRYSDTPKRLNNVVNKITNKIRRFDAAPLLGGKTFVLKQEVPYMSLPEDVYNKLIDAPLADLSSPVHLGAFFDTYGGNRFVDMSRIGSNGLIIK